VENAHGDSDEAENEMSRKLRFLEHENLQLMLDVKSTKKQLQSARDELELLRVNAVEEPTLDFGTVDLGSVAHSSLGVPGKRESDFNDLGSVDPSKGDGDVKENDMGKSLLPVTTDLRRTVLRSRDTNDANGNKENNKANTPASTKKRSFGDGQGSGKKKRNRQTPGLGEVAEDNGENPAECNQQ
jgi:hypothetical protein